MKENSIKIKSEKKQISVKSYYCHTIVLGSGAAGLNAAIRLNAEGINDLMIVTEGLKMGTSINTGSDKQTYYKLGLYGVEKDSPISLAESFFKGGSMHGDLALVEAALSPRAFLNLVNLGVPFPTDPYGQYVGYKTDHDPLQRATSVGPYTSREMCRKLIEEVQRRKILVHEQRNAVKLLTIDEKNEKRACGFIAINRSKNSKNPLEAFEVYLCENLIFAVGGPGGLYKSSVYPNVHTGAIGLALLEGAKAQSLPESQYGMASIKFRWNVSGTYMQVIPRFISTDKDGKSDEQEFLRPYFSSVGEMNSMIFLKGYQWPFDPRKIINGSSLIDILVYVETEIKGRRVFLDYRKNCEGFSFDDLSPEAKSYLEKSNALFGTPIQRLAKMNQPAIDLYLDHKIDIRKEPLEIAVCAQHNNGGLAGNIWWESVNIKHLFPIGEVNGSHGVYRPGGSALNSGQVAGFRCAEYISKKYKKNTLNLNSSAKLATTTLKKIFEKISTRKTKTQSNWRNIREQIQQRMSKAAAHIRSISILEEEVKEAWNLWNTIKSAPLTASNLKDLTEELRNSQLCYAHCIYLEAILFALKSGVGSRGSALVLDKTGEKIHPLLDDSWRFVKEDESFKEKVLETLPEGEKVHNQWVNRRSIPEPTAWFENAWADYREGKIYNTY